METVFLIKHARRVSQVALVSIGLETPRFFMFRLVRQNETHVDFWTTDLMEDPGYIQVYVHHYTVYSDALLTPNGATLSTIVFAPMVLTRGF